MSVQDRNIVDLVSTSRDGTTAILTVSDHLEWLPDNEHLLVLQDKLNDYLDFIESGELYQKYPGAKGLTLRIDVVCLYEPQGDGIRFLELAGDTIRGTGVDFGCRVLNV